MVPESMLKRDGLARGNPLHRRPYLLSTHGSFPPSRFLIRVDRLTGSTPPGGGVRIRTGVRGFAGPCLTTRPRRQKCPAYWAARTALVLPQKVIRGVDEGDHDEDDQHRLKDRG